MYNLPELYERKEETNPLKLQTFIDNKAIIDYIDTNESESA